MMKRRLLKSFLLAAALLVGGANAWATEVPYTVGTEGSGDEFANRMYSDAYEIAPGEIYHFTFTNTSYGSNNWNNWLLDCKATADTSVSDWYFTMRSDNFGWGTSYNSAMRNNDFVWGDFQTVMNGATVDMYVDYNGTDKIIRTYTTITKGETTWHYNFASKAIDQSSVFLFLSEELAVLNITTAEKVTSLPDGTYTLYKRTTTETDCGEQWKADDKDNIWVPSATNDNFTYAIDGGLSLANTSASTNFKSAYSASRVLTPNEGSTVSMSAVATMGIPSGRSSSYDYLTIGGVSLRVHPQGGASNACIAQVYIDGVAQGDAVSATRNVAYTFNVEINQTTGAVTYSVSGGATIAEATTSTSTAIANVVFGHNRGGSESYDTSMKLTNINITEQISAVSYANYTVHFQDNNGAKVKEDEVRNGEVGATVNANSADKASFYSGDYKYVYSSDGDGTTVTANGSAEFTVTYTKYGKYTYNVYAVNSSDVKLQDDPIATATTYEGENADLRLPKYLKVGSTWYVTETSNVLQTATEAGDTKVEYTLSEIDYFFEETDFSLSRSFAQTTTKNFFSRGNGGRLYSNSYGTTEELEGGVYKLVIAGAVNTQTPTMTYGYKLGDADYVVLGESPSFGNGSYEATKTVHNVVIPDGARFCWINNTGYNSNLYIDYVTLTKVETISATKEYSTFCSTWDLDFTNVDGLEAYTVSALNATSATISKVNKVASGTGLILKKTADIGTATDFDVPIATSTDALGTNYMVGVTIATSMEGVEGAYILKDGLFQPCSGGTLAAGKAYLNAAGTSWVTDNSEARSFSLIIGGDATGIADISSKTDAISGDYFDLQGRKVAQPTKGLYIVNGKKVVIK